MLSPEFDTKLSKFPNLKHKFCGTFSADTIPKQIKCKSFIICNTDVHKGIGKHWYCVVKLNKSVLECFDSLGIDERKKAFLTTNFNLKNITKIKYNVTQVQSSLSDTCGYFVLYFLIQRFHNQDLNFNDLLNEIFQKDVEQNEILVRNFAKVHFEDE